MQKKSGPNIDSICLKRPNLTNPNPNPNLNLTLPRLVFHQFFLYIFINIAISRCLQKKSDPNIDSICLKRPNPSNPNPNPTNPNPNAFFSY